MLANTMHLALAFIRHNAATIGPKQRPFVPRAMVVSSYDLGSTTSRSSSGSHPHHHNQQRYSSSGRSDVSSDPNIVLDPLVVCGPSGVGKGTIIQQFMQSNREKSDNPLQFDFSVSHTTRNPRPGEQDGVHYHFVSKTKMQSLIGGDGDNNENQSFFVEWAEVHGNYYGTSWEALLRVRENGRKSLLDIDVQGVQRLKQLQELQKNPPLSPAQQSFVFAPKYIFIAPPSLESLQERLRLRATETDDALQTRLRNAASEVVYGTYPGNFDAIVINDQLEAAVKEFETVVRELYQN